jgi:hypothetical protein
MRFYYLSPLQKLEIGIATFIFCFFIGFMRPFILNKDLNSKKIITYTLLFFAWYGMTLMFTNAFTYESVYKKIVNI